MNKISSEDTGRLPELLGEELDYYKQIRKLTEEQVELLGKDDMEAFNGSLNKREELIEKIKGLHQEKETLMQSCASTSKNANPQNEGRQNKEVDDLNKQIREIIEACAEINDRNILSMKEKTEDLTKKIDEQSSKRKGIGGYVQSVPNTPEMFDKKS
ncbi:MAG: flagellar protein FlgN [Oscillospiraceae bacterium]|nr:flagellar protein FlgN [Oscillospiraceae bacterium]